MPQSFDIFDTLLTRLVSPPETIFELLGARIQRDGNDRVCPESFARHRREAEARARRYRPSGEVALTDIYAELAFTLSLSEEDKHALLSWELDLERQFLTPVPHARSQVAEARQRGEKILYVSDMYLPSGFLIEQLREHQFWQEGDRLYLSCERSVSKGNGALFQLIEEDLNLPGSAFCHTGNHPVSDGSAARSRGWSTRVLPQNNANRYEQLMEGFSGQTSGLTAHFAGASRLARLGPCPKSSGDQVIVNVAAGVVAPALVSFLLWVFREAREQKIDRLYFLSRDGQILHEMAKLLAPKLGLNLDLHYLYGSRQAWHTARTRVMDDFFQDYLLESPDGLSLQMIFERLGIEMEPLTDDLAACGLSLPRAAELLEPEDLDRVKSLFARPAFTRLLAKTTEDNRDRLLAYLRQEGLDRSGKSALVDIGWTGKSLRSLYDILGEVQIPLPPAFLFGLLKDSSGGFGPRPRSFLFDAQRKLGPVGTPDELRYFPIFIENFCAGDHGGLRGFFEKDGKMHPDLRSADNRAVLDWGLPVLRETVYDFCKQLRLPLTILDRPLPLAPFSADLLRLFYESPSPEEARIWGAFPAETDPNGAFRHQWATPYRWSDAWHLLRWGHLPETSTCWRPARDVVTPHFRRRLIRFTFTLRSRASRWKNRLVRRSGPAPQSVKESADLALANDTGATLKS